jgi:hypothetical protein
VKCKALKRKLRPSRSLSQAFASFEKAAPMLLEATRRPWPLRWTRLRISDLSGSIGAWRRSCHTDPEPLLQSGEKGLRGFQIGRLEPFGESVVDRLKERQRLRETVLIA